MSVIRIVLQITALKHNNCDIKVILTTKIDLKINNFVDKPSGVVQKHYSSVALSLFNKTFSPHPPRCVKVCGSNKSKTNLCTNLARINGPQGSARSITPH